MPAIYGDKIVYLDDQNGEWGRYNIYVYNLTTSEETQITTDSSYFDPSKGPAIYGDTIVWQGHHYNNGVWENTGIHIYNLSTLKETQIINSVSAFQPDIYEDRIVYLDALRDGEICMYNLSTAKKLRITTNESRPHNLDI